MLSVTLTIHNIENKDSSYVYLRNEEFLKPNRISKYILHLRLVTIATDECDCHDNEGKPGIQQTVGINSIDSYLPGNICYVSVMSRIVKKLSDDLYLFAIDFQQYQK